jgi:hypothetical protein
VSDGGDRDAASLRVVDGSPTMSDPFQWLQERAEQRIAAGLRRRLRPRPADSPLLDLAGNDYLGRIRSR